VILLLKTSWRCFFRCSYWLALVSRYFPFSQDEDITGSIPVFEWSICKEEPDQKKKNCFSISSQKRTYYIQADTPEQMRQWLQVRIYPRSLSLPWRCSSVFLSASAPLALAVA
jgi:hypothetical protein